MTNEERLDELEKEGRISGKIRKIIEREMTFHNKTPDQVIEELGLQQLGDQESIEPAVAEYIKKNRHLGKTIDGMIRELMNENPKVNPQHIYNRLQVHLKKQFGMQP